MMRPPASPALDRVAEEWAVRLPEPLRRIAPKCLVNTFETSVFWLDDGTTYVITGDIPAMWLRDSAAQVETYLRWVREDDVLRRTIRGLIAMQARMIVADPYANAFNERPTGREQFPEDQTERSSPWAYERKYEVDSLCYPVRLLWRYLEASGDTSVCTAGVRAALDTIRATWRREQRRCDGTPYGFHRPNAHVAWDTLSHDGRGAPVGYTGMTWSGFRPSDDACTYGYLIPAQQFAAAVLRYMADLYRQVWHDAAAAQDAEQLRIEIEDGINRHAVVEHPEFGRVYAYETDGLGRHLLMDDANIPSLLSAPYLGYCQHDDPVYQNTRRFVLTPANPHFVSGRYAAGVGSPHTRLGGVWPLSLIMQGITATDRAEQEQVLAMLTAIDAGTGYMHEAVDPDDPARFTRPWFGWANSLFAELVARRYEAPAQS